MHFVRSLNLPHEGAPIGGDGLPEFHKQRYVSAFLAPLEQDGKAAASAEKRTLQLGGYPMTIRCSSVIKIEQRGRCGFS